MQVVFLSYKNACAYSAGTFHKPMKSLIVPRDKIQRDMRPKTDQIDKLQERIILRVTTHEKRILLQRYRKEGYHSMSDFCRAKLVKKREVRKVEVSDEFLDAVKRLDYDLSKIGANLNQLAKAINTNSVYGFDEHDRKLLGQISSKLKDSFKAFESFVHMME